MIGTEDEGLHERLLGKDCSGLRWKDRVDGREMRDEGVTRYKKVIH